MNKKKKVMLAAVSFLLVCLIVCGCAVSFGKKDSSDSVITESVTFDSAPSAEDPDTPHSFTQGTADSQISESDKSNAADESITIDPVDEGTSIPDEGTSDNDSLPSHSFTPGTP